MWQPKSLTVACLVVLGLVQIAVAQTDERIYRIGEEGVTPPKVASRVEPAYTDEARNAKIEGVVILSLEIDADGLAHNVQVVRSLDGGLDQSAVAAVQQWRFKPAEKNGKPVRVVATIDVRFHLT